MKSMHVVKLISLLLLLALLPISSASAAPNFAFVNGWSALGGSGDGALNGDVYAIASDSSGNIYVGGYFTDAGGVANADYIAKWNGSSWSALSNNAANTLNGAVNAIAIDSANNIYVGGSYTNAGGIVEADYIAKWNGKVWSALGTGPGDHPLSNGVNVLALRGDDALYVGGGFVNAGGEGAADYIALWNVTGSSWHALGYGATTSDGTIPPSTVFDIAIKGNVVYVGGSFTNINNKGSVLDAADYIAYYDGSDWNAMGSNGAGGGAVNDRVTAVAIHRNDVYIGGQFTDVSDEGSSLTAADYVAIWDTKDLEWQALGSDGSSGGSLNYYVDDILSAGNSQLFISGQFNNVNDNGYEILSADHVVLWDGDNWVNLGHGLGPNGAIPTRVKTVGYYNSVLYAGGMFQNVNNGGTALPEADYIAKFVPDTDPPEGSTAYVSSSGDAMVEISEGGLADVDVNYLMVDFDEDVWGDNSEGGAANTANFLLVEAGTNGVIDTTNCNSSTAADDVEIPLGGGAYSWEYHRSSLAIAGGYIPLDNGIYRVFACGTTSIEDYDHNELYDGAGDFIRNFSVLGAPTTISPTGTIAGSVPNQPTFTWNAEDTATAYYLYVEDSNDAKQIGQWYNASAVCSGATCSVLSPKVLKFDSFGWLVQARNAAGAQTTNDALTSFTVNPPAPTLLLPEDFTVTTGPPTHKWVGIAGVAGYQLNYYGPGGCASGLLGTWITGNTSYKPLYTGEGVTHWNVRAVGYADNQGLASECRQITIHPLVPAAPILLSPVNKGATNDTTPTLDWNDVGFAVDYRVTLATDKKFLNLILDNVEVGSAASEYTLSSTLPEGPYYWKVQAKNSDDVWGAWSKASIFNVDTTAPPKVLLVTPKDLSSTNKTLVSFKWKPLTKDSKTYTLQLCSNDDCSSVVWEKTNLPKAGYKMPKDQPGLDHGRYWWRVKVFDWATNEGEWSEIYTFVVGLPKKPVDGSATTKLPVFQWNKVKTAVGYCLQVSKNDSFTALVIDKPDGVPFTVTKYISTAAELDEYLNYYWRVAADEGSGCGPWSATMLVHYTDYIPGRPVLQSPLNKALFSTADSIDLQWLDTSIVSGLNFTVQLASDKYFANSLSESNTGDIHLNIGNQAAGTYYWRVQSYNGLDARGKWSATFTFTVLP